MRKAIMSELQLIEGETNKYEKVEVGPVKFLEFSVNYDQCENGVGTYASAIVELADGRLDNVPVEMIQFTDDDITLQ